MEAARRADAKVVFDIDDLLFRPELARAEIIDGIRSMGQNENDARELCERFRKVLTQADNFTTTTVPLAEQAKDLGKPTTIIPNGYEPARLEASRAAHRAREARAGDGVVRVGYFSGTLTHQQDLALASRAVAAVLAENPQVRLVLWRETVNLAEFPELEQHAEQIEWRDRVPRGESPREYAQFDINIAPLEIGNPFCEAKSELKFFEAALVGIPTVASPTQPYATAIRHAETGFLADSDQQWYQLLRELVQSPELRTSVGNRAYEAVLWQYGPERRQRLVTSLITKLLAS
jgi:glycosyltransferase involved in cell wall biosynthesis